MHHITIQDQQAALGFVTQQRTFVERQVNETVYPEIQYPSLIPVDTSAPEWTKFVEYRSMDRVGRARWINGNADDIPKADLEMASNVSEVFMAGIGYGYGFEEINVARVNGVNLSAEKAIAARRAYEEFVDRIAFVGDTTKGFYGFMNNPNVTAAAAPNGNWLTTASADEILADLIAGLTAQYAGTLNTAMANTVILPYAHLAKLDSTPRSTQSDVTIAEWFSRSNPYTRATGQPITLRSLMGLETAGVGGSARAIFYRRDPQVLKLHIPMPHRFLPVWQSGPLRWEVPGVFRLGGLEIRRPAEVRYMDGI